jgi:hypothetical protein
MHVYDYRSGRRNGIGHCLVLLQAPHIVHDNAEIDWARGADIGFVCIDRDRDVAVPELGENESDAGKLLGFGDERRSRPRRLPPTSMISAPYSPIRIACESAASAAKKRSPLENEASVTLRTPMKTRVPILSRKASRLAR